MSVVITLHVYSGLPDPTWELDESQTQELRELILSTGKRSLMKPPGLSGRLGYRGFSIKSVGEPNLEADMYVDSGLLDVGQFDLSIMFGDQSFENFLLSTSKNSLGAELKGFVQGEIDKYSLIDSSAFVLDEPPYNPGKWNNNPDIRTRNNCYNYANDIITNTFAQPGRGSGTTGPYPPNCSGTGAASERDGLPKISNPSMTPAEGQIVALVVSPEPTFLDYHWYRRDDNGMWSHKAGQTPARNTDNSGQLISDPETCDRGPYTHFCGYYHAVPANVNIS